MKRWLLIGVPLVVLVVLIVWRLGLKRSAAEAQSATRSQMLHAPAGVTVATVGTRDVVETYTGVGTIESPFNVKIAPKVTGLLQYLQLREGDPVKVGDVVARIDPTQVLAQVHEQQAAVTEAQYRLAQAEITQNPAIVQVNTQINQQVAGLESSSANYRQTKENYDATVAAAVSAVVDAQGKVNNAKAGVDSAKADYNQVVKNDEAHKTADQAAINDAKGRVNGAKAGIVSAQATINSAQANLNDAQVKYDRTFKLYKQGFVAAQDVDDARTAVDVQQGALGVAQSQLNANQSALDSSEAQLNSSQQQYDIDRVAYEASTQDAQAKVAQAAAGLDSFVAELRSAEDQAKITKVKGVADIEASLATQHESQSALEYARSNVAQKPAYEANLAALRAAVANAQGSLGDAESQLSDTTMRSPVQGYVTARYMDPGSIASPTQPILNIQATNQLWVTISVPEEVSRKIFFGQTASFTLDAIPGRTLTSHIVQINPSTDPTSRQFMIRALIDNPGTMVKTGMFARISIEVEHLTNAVAVPREAVHLDASGNSTVFVVDAQNKAHLHIITIAGQDPAGYAVSSGVAIGDKVVTLSTRALRDGQQVKMGAKRGAAAAGAALPGGNQGSGTAPDAANGANDASSGANDASAANGTNGASGNGSDSSTPAVSQQGKPQ